MIRAFDRRAARQRRHRRIRKAIAGVPDRPRMSVFRSLNHIYGQVIDDTSGRTVVAASSLDRELRDKLKGTKSDVAREVGQALAARAKKAGIASVVFDRGGFLYHGRVRAFAEGVRAGGLEF